jgi:hypothetical protein
MRWNVSRVCNYKIALRRSKKKSFSNDELEIVSPIALHNAEFFTRFERHSIGRGHDDHLTDVRYRGEAIEGEENLTQRLNMLLAFN